MSELKYTVIKTKEQYYQYCNLLEEIYKSNKKTEKDKEAYGLLFLLIKYWENKDKIMVEIDL